MQSSKQIKQNAKLTLNNRWGSAVGVVMIGFCVSLFLFLLEDLLVNFVFSIFSIDTGGLAGNNILTDPTRITLDIVLGIVIRIVFLLLSALISYPVSIGIKRYFWGITAGSDEKVSTVFDYFGSFSLYGRAVSLALQIFLRVLGYVVLLLLPYVGFTVFSQIADRDYIPLISLLSYLCLVGAVVGIIPIALRYFMSPYLLVNNDEITPRECIQRSVKITRGYKVSYFIFMISFIGWILLCAFVLPVLYVFPYMQASFAHFAHQLMQQYAKREMMEKSGNTQVIIY